MRTFFFQPFLRRAAHCSAALLILSCAAFSFAADVNSDIEAASRRALDWIDRHAPNPEEATLSAWVDEGLSLRQLASLSRSSAERARLQRRFRDWMTEVDTSEQYRAWVADAHKPLLDHYYLVLADYLAQVAGAPRPQAETIHAQALQALIMARFESPTLRLTTTLFLVRVTAADADLDNLLAGSLIARFAWRPQQLDLVLADSTPVGRAAGTWLLYALVHEVAALTDFGQAPEPAWLAARHEALTAALGEGLSWASAGHNLDLSAELLVTLYFLGEPLNASLSEALERLVAAQRADGAWDASPAGGAASARHTTLTCAAALLAWRDRIEPQHH